MGSTGVVLSRPSSLPVPKGGGLLTCSYVILIHLQIISFSFAIYFWYLNYGNDTGCYQKAFSATVWFVLAYYKITRLVMLVRFYEAPHLLFWPGCPAHSVPPMSSAAS